MLYFFKILLPVCMPVVAVLAHGGGLVGAGRVVQHQLGNELAVAQQELHDVFQDGFQFFKGP